MLKHFLLFVSIMILITAQFVNENQFFHTKRRNKSIPFYVVGLTLLIVSILLYKK